MPCHRWIPWGAASVTTLAALLHGEVVGQTVCKAISGTQRVPVVELYTSEGCSSCPPADRQLAALSRAAPEAMVPLAWHVDFWDYLGWRDPYAQAGFAQRQRQLVQANGQRTVYTPHVFVGGREVRDRSRIEATVQAQRRNPAPWRIEVEGRAAGAAQWQLSAQAVPASGESAAVGTRADPVDLIMAVTEDGLVSRVRAGENAGERLQHAHVVRHWWVSTAGTTPHPSVLAQVTLTPEQNSKGVDLVAFVQNRRTLEVLQSVRVSGCLRG